MLRYGLGCAFSPELAPPPELRGADAPDELLGAEPLGAELLAEPAWDAVVFP